MTTKTASDLTLETRSHVTQGIIGTSGTPVTFTEVKLTEVTLTPSDFSDPDPMTQMTPATNTLNQT